MNAQLILRDAFGRTSRKVVELEATTISQALTDLGTFATAWADVSDVGIDAIVLQQRDVSLAAAPQTGANLDVGGTIKGVTDDGYAFAYHIPGIKEALVDTSGSIDISASVMVTFLNQFKAAGALRVSRGNTVSTWISGKLDK
jgi:hypothetical protein